MKNDNAKFKNEFKRRMYDWVLRLVKFIDKLPKDSPCNVMGKQIRSGTSMANYRSQPASSKKDFINFSPF